MFLKLIEAGADKLDAVKIYKKGRNTTDIYTREISPKDWMTKSGYTTRVWSMDEKRSQDTDVLQKLNAAKMFMPDNPKLNEVYQRKLLEFSDLSPDDINEIMEYEKRKQETLVNQPGLVTQPTAGQPAPATPVQQQV
jgi:hypothetical protein